MSNAVLQGVRLATAQESRFQAVKCSDMWSGILQESRFADSQESCFQAANRSNMSNAVLQGVD